MKTLLEQVINELKISQAKTGSVKTFEQLKKGDNIYVYWDAFGERSEVATYKVLDVKKKVLDPKKKWSEIVQCLIKYDGKAFPDYVITAERLKDKVIHDFNVVGYETGIYRSEANFLVFSTASELIYYCTQGWGSKIGSKPDKFDDFIKNHK